MKTRIMLVDDHRMFREALRIRLNAEADIEVAEEAGTGEEALALAERTQPDIVVLDIAMSGMNGIDILKHLLALNTRLRVLALSGYTDRMYVNEMLKAGAEGYVVKSAGADELVRAIRAVRAGHVFLSPEVTRGLASSLMIGGNTPPASILGPREREVLELLARGRRSADIADQLGISTATVKTHRRNIKQKLGIATTAELTSFAIREGLLAS